jgi:hypothetical protein
MSWYWSYDEQRLLELFGKHDSGIISLLEDIDVLHIEPDMPQCFTLNKDEVRHIIKHPNVEPLVVTKFETLLDHMLELKLRKIYVESF